MSHQRLTFSQGAREKLLQVIGRRDVRGHGMVDDLEQVLDAYLFVRRGERVGGVPREVDFDLADVALHAGKLLLAVNRLPQDIDALIEMHLLSESTYRRLKSALSTLSAPLKDVAEVSAQIRQRNAEKEAVTLSDLRDRLISGIAGAYRNRLNLRPRGAAGDPFMAVLDAVLIVGAAHAEEFAGVREQVTLDLVAKIILVHLGDESDLVKVPFDLPKDDKGPMVLGG